MSSQAAAASRAKPRHPISGAPEVRRVVKRPKSAGTNPFDSGPIVESENEAPKAGIAEEPLSSSLKAKEPKINPLMKRSDLLADDEQRQNPDLPHQSSLSGTFKLLCIESHF